MIVAAGRRQHRRAQRPPHGRRSRTSAPAPAATSCGPGEFVVSLHFPLAGAQQRRRLAALHPAQRDGHRRRQRRRLRALRGQQRQLRRASPSAPSARRVLVVTDAADALVGKPLTDETIEAAGEAAKAAARPIDDMRGSIKQRKHLSAVLVERTLREAARRARGG